MALSIKSDEADRLARELAAETGETLTEAVETGQGAARPGARPACGQHEFAAAAPGGRRCGAAGGRRQGAGDRRRLRRRWPAALTVPGRGSLVVDTSAVVAIILGERRSKELAVHLENAITRLMSPAIRVELGIVIEARFWPAGQDIVDRFLRDANIDIVPVDADLAARAMSGWRRYGKGRHPAGPIRRLLHLRTRRADRVPGAVHRRRLRCDRYLGDSPRVGAGTGLTSMAAYRAGPGIASIVAERLHVGTMRDGPPAERHFRGSVPARTAPYPICAPGVLPVASVAEVRAAKGPGKAGRRRGNRRSFRSSSSGHSWT